MQTLRCATGGLILLLIGTLGCGQEVAEKVAQQVQQLEQQLAIEQAIWIRLDSLASVRVNNDRTRRLASLASDLEARAARYTQAGQDPTATTVRIKVDDDTPFRHFDHLIIICQQSGFSKFELEIGSYLFPVDRSPQDNFGLEFPPLKVRLRADEAGGLASVSLNDRELADVGALQVELISLIGSERGPGSIQAAAELEIDADDRLRFAHVAAVYEAASGYDTDEGGRVRLVDTIWPARARASRRFEIVEPIEDFEIIEEVEVIEEIDIEPLDVETSEVQVFETAIAALPELGEVPFQFDVEESPVDSTPRADPKPAKPAKPAKAADTPADEPPLIVVPPAVDAAFRWLRDHQSPSGNWNFDHRAGECGGRCGDPGTATDATNAATAMALLPFLSLGQTHKRGEYRDTVGRGVDYLVKSAKKHTDGLSFHEKQGMMYSHGLATIALCETYRQTKDKQLEFICQSALDFIVYAQDPVGGGWRYTPRQPGDTSVVGWQVAALRTGQLAGLNVPAETVKKAGKFLDSVQSEDLLTYGYTTPGTRKATTASGLLSRVHLDGKRDDKTWRLGVRRILEVGPSTQDMYFNYHATQLLAQRGEEPWATWHESIRSRLLEQQVTKKGHAAGSWYMGQGHTAARGGRLFNTSVVTLMLTNGYRHLGIFQDDDARVP